MDRKSENHIFFVILLTLTVAAVSRSAPAQMTNAEIYLSQFGYLSPKVRNPSNGGNLLSQESWENAIREFQGFAGLNISGELDDETLKTMTLPRCGVKDKVGFGSDSRSKRYALQGSRWKVKNLTYRISKYPKKLNRDEVDKEVAKAFAVWSEYTDLSFTAKKTNPVHIDIRFETGEHGDGDPFDGPGGTLAHAYFPVYGGDAHFDDSEQWTINSARGTNLFQVAAHEFGHSLGLSHSDVRSALMAPFYRGYDPVFKLDSDDIQGIQALYGRKTGSSGSGNGGSSSGGSGSGSGVGPSARTTIPPKMPRDDDALCRNAKIDAIFNTPDGSTYAFKGDKYFRLTENAIADGYPKLISEGWPGLPSNLDAAFTYKNGKSYFFKGSKYWRYNGRNLDGDYPKDINEGFTGIPNDIDAAMVWSGNGKIYFYKGSKFWRFDPQKRPPVKSTYPKPLANWEGIPDGIDAALQYTNGYTYFFKGDKYYRFNDRTFAVDAADPAFPRPTAHWWFGCQNSPSQFSGNMELNRGANEDENGYDFGNIDAGHDERPAHDNQYQGDTGNSINPIFLLSVLLPAILISISRSIWH